MAEYRARRLTSELLREGAGAAILSGAANVAYSAGLLAPPAPPGEVVDRHVTVVFPGDADVVLFGGSGRSVAGAVTVEEAVFPETDSGATALVGLIADKLGGSSEALVVVDDLTAAMSRQLERLLPRVTVADAASALARARLLKGEDEVSCLRIGQRLTERAMERASERLTAGATARELTRAFLEQALSLGLDGAVLEPVWHPVPAGYRTGYFSSGPLVPFPAANPARPFALGEVLWTDTGAASFGYHSDYGSTWIVGREPDRRQRDQFRRWRDVVDAVAGLLRPGSTGRELTEAATAANGGSPPWLSHLYLAHGIGLASAEAPLVGTDLGADHDESTVLQPGMTVVVEPVIWQEGQGGYRAEEMYLVTASGCERISSGRHEPFDAP